MELPKMITMWYFGNRMDVAQFVYELLSHSKPNYRSITITNQDMLEGCFVTIAIEGSWDDTVEKLAQTFCLELMNI